MSTPESNGTPSYVKLIALAMQGVNVNDKDAAVRWLRDRAANLRSEAGEYDEAANCLECLSPSGVHSFLDLSSAR